MSVEEDTRDVKDVVHDGGSATLIIGWLFPGLVVVGVIVLLGWCCSRNGTTSSEGKRTKGSPGRRLSFQLSFQDDGGAGWWRGGGAG